MLFEGLEEVARRFQVAVALLHFGATQAKRFGPVSITLTAAEGSRFAALPGVATIIHIHYEGWTHLTEGRDEIEQAFLRLDGRNNCAFCRWASPFPLTCNIWIRTAVVALQYMSPKQDEIALAFVTQGQTRLISSFEIS